MDLNQFNTSQELESDGVWVDFDDARFRIRSTAHPAYKKAMQAAVKRHGASRVKKDFSVAIQAQIEAFADEIILDWENVSLAGEDLEPTPENKRKLLEYPQIRDYLHAEANDYLNFQTEDEAATAAALKSGD